MAADNVGIAGVTDTLTAATARKFQLTGPGQRIRITHHGGAVVTPVFFTVAPNEASLVAASSTADEMMSVPPGQSRVVQLPSSPAGAWVSVISSGAPIVSVELSP